jgi:hypothetical protein
MTIKRAKIVLLLFLAGLVIVALIALRVIPAKGVNRRLEAMRAAGLPTSAIELDLWYKAIPPEDNRALLIEEAARDLVAVPAELDPKTKGETTPAQTEAIAVHLQKNRVAIAKLHDAVSRPGSRFSIDASRGFSTLVPHLAPVKSLVQLLNLDAIYQARTGHPEAALRSLQASLAVVHALRQEPLYISQIVAIACLALTLNAVEAVLSESPLADRDLADLNTALAAAEADEMPGIFRGLVGERAIGIGGFRSSFQQFKDFSGGTGRSEPSDWLRGLGYQAYIATGFRERDLECYLELMDLFTAAQQSGFPGALQKSEDADRAMQTRFSTGLGRFAIFSRMLLPSIKNGTLKEAEVCARLRCAQIAVALERYRAKHQDALPENLDDLAPEYLHKIPTDPHDGSALQYERLPNKGYRIISEGASGKRKRSAKDAEKVAITVTR